MKNFLNSDVDANLNEIIFANRNKDYGAYAFRAEEGKTLRKSLFLGVSIFVALVITPLIISSLKADVVEGDEVYLPPVWVEPPVIDKPEETPPNIVTPPKQDQVKTFNSSVPTPTKNTDKEKPASKIDDYDKGVASLVDKEGTEKIVNYKPPVTQPPTNLPSQKPVEPAVDINKPYVNVDVEANFNGGINAFREKVGQNFDTSTFDGNGEKITANVTFIVERDGTISNIKATGKDAIFNKEAEKTVKSIRGNWKPAKIKGQAVRSYFNIPITMQFD